jgi:hypothetical protein
MLHDADYSRKRRRRYERVRSDNGVNATRLWGDLTLVRRLNGLTDGVTAK